MSGAGPVRRAGAGRTEDGARITWVVAEGRRGRRWRETRVERDGRLSHSLLLETDPDDRFAHLELSTSAGLMTLHPEGDGTLHGNVVGNDDLGVHHIEGEAWSDDGIVLVEGSPLCLAAASRLLGRRIAPSTSGPVLAVRIPGTPDAWRVEPVPIERIHERRWRVLGGPVLTVDPDGLPVLADQRTWPLEA